MEAKIIIVEIVFSLFISFINGYSKSTVVFSPLELERDGNLSNNSPKFALRYGFQQTSECKDFPKAYICIQKCLDLGFDVAHSDKYCFCTCYHKLGKLKSTSQTGVTKTKWKHGAPSTRLPVWAASDKDSMSNETEDIQYVLVEGNATYTTEDAHVENSTAEVDTNNSTATTDSDAGERNTTGTTIDADSGTGATGGTNDNSVTDNGGTTQNSGTSDGTGGTENPA